MYLEFMKKSKIKVVTDFLHCNTILTKEIVLKTLKIISKIHRTCFISEKVIQVFSMDVTG